MARLDDNVQSFPLKELKTEKDYKEALQVLDKLFDTKSGDPNSDYVDVLSLVIENYETKHYAITEPDPIEAIKARMDDLDLTVSKLGEIIGLHQSSFRDLE